MKKLNKKGFTLVEMLVVIAIIAVLVAIIIPTVMSATAKASAATNAANLRSVKAELTTALLTKDQTSYEKAAAAAPKSKACQPAGIGEEAMTTPTWADMTKEGAPEEVTVTYKNITIEQFAAIAETGKLPEAPKTPAE